MVDVRVSAASGTSTDWAASTLVLGVGQFAWETDTGILRVGDGLSLEQNLPVLATLSQSGKIAIGDDGPVSGVTVWSSAKVNSAINDALVAANKYTDQALTGGSARFDVAFQNSDGTWPSRPNAYCVFAFGYSGSTVAPTWLTSGVDSYFARP